MGDAQYCLTLCDEEAAAGNSCLGFEGAPGGKGKNEGFDAVLKPPALPFRLLAEFVGTTTLIMVGCGSCTILSGVDGSFVGQVLSWGAVLIVLIYMFRKISGAHFNPAMSLAFALNGDVSVPDALAYSVVQCLGATTAAFLLVFLVQPAIHGATLGAVAPTEVSESIGVWRGLLTETLLTFFLSSSIFLSVSKEFGAGDFAPIVIGVALIGDILLGARLTGASMNPARSLGPALSETVMQGAPSRGLEQLWLYVIGPCMGACAGLLLYHLLRLGSTAANRRTKLQAQS